VYVNLLKAAYNFGMRAVFPIVLLCWVFAPAALGQSVPSDSLSIDTSELPPASLWETYRFRLRASGGRSPYDWRWVGGSLPANCRFVGDGRVEGTVEETGQFQFTLLVGDSSNPAIKKRQQFRLLVEAPLRAVWEHKAQVNGKRIDGSVKVSNGTGRDFDLTFIVLAVNEIGRATAIGYQHFPLKRQTRDMEIPFGETLSPGNYAVHVDVVGEEPVSNSIFRARLVIPQQSVTEGP
jgi:hypothetical protein